MIHCIRIAALAVLLPALALSQVRLLRHPSYSQSKVAFSYLGDIWIANENGSGVTRLTDHKARDIYPRFSPDGRWIAFSSNRQGNYDVYVIAAAGGKPRQLTFHSADDNVVGWTPDGKRILFQSTRGQGAFPSVATLYEVAAEGGMEQPLATDWGSSGSYSPDGSKLAFTRHPGVWSRQHYRGSYAVDLWVMDTGSKKFTRLGDPDYKGNYLWPMFGRGNEIYFVADRLADEKHIKFGGPEVMKSVNNIWRIPARGGAAVQVTRHTSGSLFFPSISADGKTIVYEEHFGLWKLDLASNKSSEIRIDIQSDVKDNEVELRTIQSEAEGFNLSPSTRRAAIATHGEIFTIATDRGEVQRVTDTPWRERDPRWSPDGKRIAFISDRTGREEIWIAGELGRDLKQLTNLDCEKLPPAWAPDSKSLVWAGYDHKLRRVDIESGKTEILAANDFGNITQPQFSPDGKWIAYTQPDRLLHSHVWVRNLETGVEKKIGGDEFLQSFGARWTRDGRKLLLLGGSGLASIASLTRSSTQLYSVALTRVDKNPDDRDVDSEEQAQAGGEGGRRGPGAGGPGGARVEVRIDWDGIDRRLRQLTRLPGSVVSVTPSPDSRTYALIAIGGSPDEGGGAPAIYTIAEDGSRLNRISQASPPETPSEAPRRRGFGIGSEEVQWSRDGRSLYFAQGGGIYTAAVALPADAPAAAAPPTGRLGGRSGAGSVAAASSSSTQAAPRRVAFTIRLEVDQEAERRQVFEESWRVMKGRFYDGKMHGVNWTAAKDRYESLLPSIGDSDELRSVIMQMIGELNASHTGMTAPAGPERILTRYPGFDLEPDASGYYKVSYVYKKGPADHDYVKLAPGNLILAVNGRELKTSDNYWKFFNLVPGRKFEFRVNSKPAAEGAWSVTLEPLTSTAQANLEYERWVDRHKSMVEKLSGGQVGYLHIRAMDAPSFQKFERDLIANRSKKALIIDQRFNGGGGIDQELLEILNQRRRYQTTRGRDSVEIARPAEAFFGPLVVLQNERSASDAEMFPDGFRALGLGKLIGVPTYGAVIGTGAFRLLDGSTIRTPGTGVMTARGENMENFGVQPDILVDNTPEDFLAGRDRQIEKAVEVLQTDIR
jgi:tricorn protease